MAETGSPTLVAFDFDHTLIEDNSDVYVQRLSENGRLPADIEGSYRSGGWTPFMNRVFEYLHRLGVTPDRMLELMSTMTWTPGMKDLVSLLDRKLFELVVISDSNSIFIQRILVAAGLEGRFAAVMTNPAAFDPTGRLTISPHHEQDWCQLCQPNLCKGRVLEDYLAERGRAGVTFGRLAYVGDGRNDYCPSLRLAGADLVFPRSGMALDKKLARNDGEEVRATVRPWKTGFEILTVLQPEEQ